MAIIKCKMCGGDLNLIEGQSVAECEYCGSRQTVPSADNEKKLNLFSRANRLRAACEFDKAAGIYEAIVADFPEEAESYWGLVLCKFGIEYVDDPATGKKIPTCHRSSFESVLKDSNFELAQENAQVDARRVMREEAKQIEEIRKGIIEVSGKEQPYDIFICYKETGFDGKRTLDSVLAQDIYDALTDKGYRVFFSRITLEDKLGQAYEPYIFAALNSAKIMLVVGTDFEHFNAVWVKNEWSRYLKLMVQDKSKHLIPCYKGIDAYDMPEEFARLQAQDLDKMGAIQDILRGVEKLMPKQKVVPLVQEKVVVGNAGGSNKIASLLDRGNMALEDGDWAKADSFFEDVLNNDSKNAQAYLGKTLAQERCRTVDALIRKRKDAYQNVRPETLYIKENTAHIHQITEQYSLNGYVSADSIRDLYKFDLSYSSEVSGRQKQYHEEESWWQNHRWLSRAEKFAAGTVADTIQNEKKHLFTQLAERVKKAQEADTKAVAKLEAAYDAHIRQADEQAAKFYENGLTRCEKDYQKWLERAKNETKLETLNKLAEKFEGLGEYKDSKNLAEHCRKRAADEQDRIDAAALRKAAENAKRNKTIAVIATIAAVVTIAVTLIVTKVIVPNGKYNDAVALMDAGKYEEAIAVFKSLDGYKDSAAQIDTCETAIMDGKYADAVALLEAGKVTEAAITFGKAGSYKDAREQSIRLWGEIAQRDTVSAGSPHTVSLKADGTVVAVGSNGNGKCNVSSWKDIVAISAGSYHTVGLKADGTVMAVGWNHYGPCDVSGWKDIVAISAGYGHTVGLKADGTVVAVGWNEYGQCDVSDWNDIVVISAGYEHTVGLKADGTVVAVGYNEYGQCNVSEWKDIVAISAGYYHTVGLKADGTVVAVGDNYNGECDVSDWKDIVAISADSHTVGLKADGTVVAVGRKDDGRCDVSSWKDIVAISAGWCHTVGLKANGTVVAVGDNDDGQCNVSELRNVKMPAISDAQKAAMDAAKEREYAAAEALAKDGETGKAAIAFAKMGDYKDAKAQSLQLWNQIAVRDTIGTGSGQTIALKSDGTAVTTTYTGKYPDDRYDISDWKNVIAITSGTAHAVCLKSDNTVAATGSNMFGQCDVSDWTDIVAISAGSAITAGLKADGTVVTTKMPTKYNDGEGDVSGWTDIVAISAGSNHTVGLKSNGTVVATGLNEGGQCDVSGWTDIVAISAGGGHTVGLKADGTVVAVGDTSYGRCDVSSWNDVVAISAGGGHTVGLKSDGTVVAVGSNGYGQCDVSSWNDIVAISAEWRHTVGLKADGTVVAVGDNDDGQCDVRGWTNIKLPQ